MVKTRKKHNNNNNRQKRNTQRKKRKIHRKRLTKIMSGGKCPLTRGRLVASGSSKNVYIFSDFRKINGELLVEILLKTLDDMNMNKLEHNLLKSLFQSEHPVIKVYDYKIIERGKQMYFTYIIETCNLNLVKSKQMESDIFGYVLNENPNPNPQIAESFFQQIIKCSILRIPDDNTDIDLSIGYRPLVFNNNSFYSGEETTLELGKEYLNIDCKAENFCYQGTYDNISIKSMDIGIEYLSLIETEQDKKIAHCYIFINYFGMIFKYIYSSTNSNIFELLKDMSVRYITKEYLEEINKRPMYLAMLKHYFKHSNTSKTRTGDLTSGEMKEFILGFVHESIFEEPEIVPEPDVNDKTLITTQPTDLLNSNNSTSTISPDQPQVVRKINTRRGPGGRIRPGQLIQ